MVVREYEHAQLGQVLVAADVIRVDVRVDQETDLRVRNGGHRRDNAVGDGRELIVYEQHTVRPYEYTDVSTSRWGLKHVDIARDVDGLERRGRLLRRRGARGEERAEGQQGACGYPPGGGLLPCHALFRWAGRDQR